MRSFFVVLLLANISNGLRPIKLPYNKNNQIRRPNLKKFCTLPIFIYHSKICARIRNIDSMTTSDSSTTITTSTVSPTSIPKFEVTYTKSSLISSTKPSPSAISLIGSSTHEVEMEKSEKIQKNIKCRTIFKPLFLGGYMPTVSCFKIDPEPENEDTPMTTESSLEPLTTISMEDESTVVVF